MSRDNKGFGPFRKIDEIPHRELIKGDRVSFTDKALYEVTSYSVIPCEYQEGSEGHKKQETYDIICYVLTRVLESGKLGKSNYVIARSFNGLTIKHHRN